MNDIINEINQELREDRGKALWNKYGIYVIAFIVAIVVVVAGRQGYMSYEISARNNAANAYMSALEQENDDALSAIAAQSGEGYAMLAKFTSAARLAENNDDGAEAAYLNIAQEEGISPIYRDAAIVLSVMNAKASTSADQKIDTLSPIAGADGPWQNIALELMIGYAIEKGDLATARKHYNALRFSQNISADLNQRLTLINEVLGEE